MEGKSILKLREFHGVIKSWRNEQEKLEHDGFLEQNYDKVARARAKAWEFGNVLTQFEEMFEKELAEADAINEELEDEKDRAWDAMIARANNAKTPEAV